MTETNNDRILVLDIETRPDPLIQDSPEWWQHQREKIEPDGRIKDPLKIAAAIDDKLETQRGKMALSPLTGMIAVIGFQEWEKDEPVILVTEQLNRQGEKALLEEFALKLPEKPHLLVGWYCKEFDVPFVLGRCMLHGITLPWWPKPRDYRQVLDLCSDLGLQRGLGDWQYVMGGGFKTVDGAATLDLPLNELAEHCREDVHTTALIAMRTRFCWGGDK